MVFKLFLLICCCVFDSLPVLFTHYYRPFQIDQLLELCNLLCLYLLFNLVYNANLPSTLHFLQKHRVFCQLPNGDWALCTVITASGDESVLKTSEGKVSYLKSARKILLILRNYDNLTSIIPIQGTTIENGEPSTCKS